MVISKVLKQIAVSTTCVILSTTTAFAADFGQAVGNNVNVRATSSLDGDVLGKISNGTEFSLIEKSGNWFEISYNGESGFVSADYFGVTKTEATVSGSKVNIRSEASTSGDSLGKLSDGYDITITGKTGKWYQFSYEGSKAFIHEDYVSGDFIDYVAAEPAQAAAQDLESTYGVVTASSGVKLRKEASTNSNVLFVLPYGTELTLDRVGDEWARVVTDDGQKGYVSVEFLSIRTGERTSRSNTSASGKGGEVVSYAKQFVGTPYVWGGTNLNSGVDCSGFVYAVMKDYGVGLNRSSYDMANNGVAIEKSQLAAGDLVFFNTGGSSRISHVGIYNGDGTYTHATDGAAYGVTVTNLNSGYSANTYVTARRVLR